MGCIPDEIPLFCSDCLSPLKRVKTEREFFFFGKKRVTYIYECGKEIVTDESLIDNCPIYTEPCGEHQD
jgi:hypothetical protein